MLPAENLAARARDLTLITRRLRLRPLTPADEADLLAHEMNPAIMGQIRDPLPPADVRRGLAGFVQPWKADEGAWFGLAVEELETGQFTGLLFLRVDSYENQCVEVGYRLHPDYWRRGYTTEGLRCLLAFMGREFAVRRVTASCVAGNAGSVGVLESLGFGREGCLIQHSSLGGRWHDELLYGLILRPDAPVSGAAASPPDPAASGPA